MLKKHRHSNEKPTVSDGTPTGSNCRQRYFKTAASSSLSPTHIPSSVCCPQMLNPFGRSDYFPLKPVVGSEFYWLDRQSNNNSGESSSRKVASKETSRREVENWYYMHFRFRMEGYQSLIYAIRQSAREDSVFSEEHLDKWTLKMRFRIRRSSPLKTALVACAARLGLESDPDVIFCIDGFYGDALSGRVHNRNEVPDRVVIATSTCRAVGLGNGSCVFVSRASRNERDNASMQMQLDLLRGFVVDDGEDGLDADEEDIVGGSVRTGSSSKFSGLRISRSESAKDANLDSGESESLEGNAAFANPDVLKIFGEVKR